MKSLSIRVRLTLWYAASFAAMLVVFCVLIDALLHERLLARTNFELEEELHELVLEVGLAPTREELIRQLDLRFSEHDAFEFQVQDQSRALLFASRGSSHVKFPVPVGIADHSNALENVDFPQLGLTRIASQQIAESPDRLVVQAAIPLERNLAELRDLRRLFLTIGPVMFLIAVAGGYALARRSLRPVDEMTRSAARITAADLDERLAVVNPWDELGRLGTTLNQMLDRLHLALNEMRNFTADAAHEFRTPLCVIRSSAEVALTTPRDAAYYKENLHGILAETERLTALSNQLLVLAREDAGLAETALGPVDCGDLLDGIAGDLEAMCEEKQLNLSRSGLSTAVVHGDSDRLRRVFVNLLDNAIKYTPPGGSVAIEMESECGMVRITVCDTGIGIPEEDLPRVFDRFYRSDASRTRETGGAGLGLAICKAIVERHKGRIELRCRDSHGLMVCVWLPVLKTVNPFDKRITDGYVHSEAFA